MTEKNGKEKTKTAGNIISKVKDTVIKAIDQNDDGELDLSDVSIIKDTISAAAQKAVGTVKESAKEGSEKLGSKLEEAKKNADYKSLHPVFEETLLEADFSMPKLIRIAEMDDKHAKSEACQGSIGHITECKDISVLTIYPEKVSCVDLKFYPDLNGDVYYVNPTDRDSYYSLDDYFSYLKQARIGELQKIAQDLGAKHFKVTYKEERQSFSKVKSAGKVNAKNTGVQVNAEAEHNSDASAFTNIAVVADMDFVGHEPIEPEVKYFKNEPLIQNLIKMRLDRNPLTHQKLELKMSSSSSIKQRDAAKIDAALSTMKISGNANVSSEVQNEERRYLEYEIEF